MGFASRWSWSSSGMRPLFFGRGSLLLPGRWRLVSLSCLVESAVSRAGCAESARRVRVMARDAVWVKGPVQGSRGFFSARTRGRKETANFWLPTGTLLRRHEREPDEMTFARAGRRAIEAALQHVARAPLASAGASRFTDAAIVRRRPDVTANPIFRRALSSFITPAGAAPTPAVNTTLAAVRALVGTPAGCGLALVIAGGAAVASGAAPIPHTATLVALCDASASHHHPWHGADRLFGKSAVPEGKEEEVADDEDDDDRVSEDPRVASLASSDDPAPLDGVKLIANLAREHWASLLVAVAVAIVASLLKMHGTRHVAALYDLIGKHRAGVPRGVPTKPLLELACIRVAEACAKFLLAKVTGDARTSMEANLRRRIFACLLTEDTVAMDARCAGERRERLGSEIAHVADVVARSLTGGVKAAATAAHGVASLCRISREISLVALGMVPPGVALFGAMGALSSRAHGRAAAAKERAASIAAERLAGARTIRTFAQEDAELDRYDDALAEASMARRHATSVHALHLALFAAVPSTAVAAWLWYGGSLVERGAMTVGELTTVVPLALEVAGALAQLSEVHAEITRGIDAADKAAGVIGAAQVIEAGARRRLEASLETRARGRSRGAGRSARKQSESADDASPSPPALRGAIDFHDVVFAYPSRPGKVVLDGLTLSLRPGETFALVGPSGGGKSTVGALLERFYDPNEGSVRVDGVPVASHDLLWLRRNVGAVAQDPTLFSGTVAENIAYARPGASRSEIEAAAVTANAHGFIENFPDGYDTPVGERGAALSGGQRQRIAIARVLLADPAVLLLDEATSALDARSERLVSEALERARAGRTTVVIAHRLSTVRGADRVGVLVDGKIAEIGTHDELMRKRDGAYAELVRTQLQD